MGTFRIAVCTDKWIKVGCLTLAIAFVGCESLLPHAPDGHTSASILHPLAAPRNAIDLEVYFVTRPAGDPLMGEGFWRSLHSLSTMDQLSLESLDKHGFRFAMSPSRPPRELQSLMALSDERDPARRAVLRRYTLPSGQETVLLTSVVPDGTEIDESLSSGHVQETLHHARCLMRLRAERVDDSWVKIDIVPEIHHGRHTVRPRPLGDDWVYDQGQNSIVFYDDRLTAELNVGEILVLGFDANDPDPLAGHFFRGNPEDGIEGLLLIRVAGLKEIEPVHAGRSSR